MGRDARPALLAGAATFIVLVLGLVACGSGPAEGSQGATPSGAPTPDGRALVQSSIDATDDDGFTQRFGGTATSKTLKPGAEAVVETFTLDGVMELPTKWRLTMNAPMNGTNLDVEMISVDGDTFYARVPGMTPWQVIGPDEGPPGSLDYARAMKASMEASTSVNVRGVEQMRGVSCWIVDVATDQVKLEKVEVTVLFAEDAQKALGLSDQELAQLLPATEARSRLWIGQKDHYLYREVDDTVLDAGDAGVYEDHTTIECSEFGVPLDPPITVPKPTA